MRNRRRVYNGFSLLPFTHLWSKTGIPLWGTFTPSLSLVDRHPLHVFGAGVVGARTDDLAVDALLDHMGGPAGRAADDEDRREHRGRHSRHVVAGGAVPVEVREHLLLAPHDFFHAFRDVEKLH